MKVILVDTNDVTQLSHCCVCGDVSDFRLGWEKFYQKRDRALAQKTSLLPADIAILRQIDGDDPGLAVFVAAHAEGRMRLAHHMVSLLRSEYWDADPLCEAAHLTILLADWATSDERTILDLHRIQDDCRRMLATLSLDWTAAIELQAFANVKHPHGGKLLTPHVHVFVVGRGAAFPTAALAEAINSSRVAPIAGRHAAVSRSVMPRWEDWAHVIRYPFKGIDKNKTLYLNPVDGRTSIHESEKGDRFVRYLRLYQILSLIRQKDLMFASGRGVQLRQNALSATRRSLRADGMLGGSIRMNDVRRFWEEFMPRMNWSRFEMPTIIPPTASGAS